MTNPLRPFHLAIPVSDLAVCRKFYGETLGFPEGRSSDHWVDFNMYGHQLVIHYQAPKHIEQPEGNEVDGHSVPVPHFGVVLTMENWRALAAELREKDIQFIIKPYIRFEGQVGEQATMFFLDPCGNALEFKAFDDLSSLFAK